MSYQIKQSTTAYELLFLMIDSTDHVTGKTGLSPTVTIRKAGGSFASPAGAVTEIADGWYKVAGNATDTGTLGPLVLHATGTGADPVDDRYEVVAFDPQDVVRLGITALPNAAAEASGGIVTRGTGTGQISVAGGRANADVTYWSASAVAAVDTAGYPKVTVKSGAGTGELDVTSGVVKSNLSAILGTALTQTYSIATAFKNFFDVLTARLTCSSYNLDGDLWTRVGSPATTSISADIAALKTVADDVPTTAEFQARTLAAADYGTATAIAALNNLSAAQVATELATYDAPTNAEMVARTLLAAEYSTAAALSTAAGYIDTEVAAIKTKTDYLPSATAGAAGGVAIVGSSMGLSDGAVTAAKFAADAITASALAADAVTEIQSGLSTVTTAQVLTQVNAALDTAIAELGIATPATTPTMRTGLMLLYMQALNDSEDTQTLRKVKNAAGTVVAQATMTSSSSGVAQGKLVSP